MTVEARASMYRVRSRVALFAAVAPLMLTLPAQASEPEPAARPRIGLVLSGGGARGAAHIGVLRALEDLQVPIDAIAGTSMGAVVGGLYAAGLSAREVEHVFEQLDWPELLRDRAPRRELVYRRKQDDRSFLVDGALGVRRNEGVVLPLGLLQGQKITQALRASTLRVADIREFDRLPTPFRAVATDLETGESVVLASGDLATVLRASMSAPGVLAPVEVGGRLLVDGGLVDNLPVELARAMGVDVIIAVDVSSPLSRRDQLESALDVTNQMIGIMIKRDTQASLSRLQPRDVLVTPELGNMSSLDFARVPLVAMAGKSAAEAVRERLAPLSIGAEDYQRHVAARSARETLDFELDFVRPGPRSSADAARIEAVFGDMAGETLQPGDLRRRMGRVYGLDRYESVDYRLAREGEDSGLEIDLRRKSWGPNFLRFGLSLEQEFEGGTNANAAVRLVMTGLNRLDAEWLNEAQLGDDPRLFSEFYQPLSLTSDWFIAPSARYELRTLQLVDDGDRIARYRIRESELAVAVGAQLSDWGEARFGLRRGDGSARVQVGDPSLPAGDFDLAGWFLQFGYDQLDSVDFPKRGQAFRARWTNDRESMGASVDAELLEASWQMARSIDRHTLVLSVDAGSALDDRFVSPQNLFTLGGLFDLSGLPSDALSGTQYGIARLIGYRRVSRGGTGVFEFPAYLGASLEAGNTWATRDDVDLGDLETAGSVFVGADSPLGPLYLAAGFSEGGERSFYLILGKTF